MSLKRKPDVMEFFKYFSRFQWVKTYKNQLINIMLFFGFRPVLKTLLRDFEKIMKAKYDIHESTW